MTVGYSLNMAKLVRAADGTKLGVQLGRLCVKRGIPVAAVAARTGVSPRTVYSWFTGAHDVLREPSKTKVQQLIAELQQQQN